MTNIIDRNNSIKTLSTQDELRTRLIKKFQCYGYFKDVEKEVIQEIVKKANGNPLLCLSLAFHLLTVINI